MMDTQPITPVSVIIIGVVSLLLVIAYAYVRTQTSFGKKTLPQIG